LERIGRFLSRLGEALSAGVSRLSWASSLRVLTVAILVAVLIQASILILVAIVAQSDRWDLPNGRLLQTILSSCQVERSSRGNVDNEQVLCPTLLSGEAFPRALRDAVVASEDERFFWHGALDFRSTLRAAWLSLWGDRQGGSTITQQLARSLLLKKEDSFDRKLLEAVLAVRISAMLTREEILTRYLNAVPHARNLAGFDGPARYYFGVGVQDLTLAEAALLVGMLPEPNNRDPLRNPASAFEAASGVLRRMLDQGKLTAQQAAEAKGELERRVFARRLRRGDEAYARLEYRPYRDLAIREAKANGIELPRDYRLILFIDPEFQQRLVGQICSVTGRHQAAGFFMRPSGEVLALAGSCTYTGEWNRATDIKRSIGSTGKLFPLIGLHELSVSLKQRVSTRPVRPPNWPAESNSVCLKRNAVRLDFALDHSCNRPWTETAMRLGPRLDEIVKRFDLSPAGSPALVPLGGLHSSPMKLTQAYATLQNRGAIPQIRFLVAAIGSRGNIIVVPAAKEERRAMSARTAQAVLQDLRGPVKRGTARAANSVHALVFGKTGTSSRNMDALFVGLTQDFVGSVWLGHDRPAPMPGVHGGGGPAKAFAKLTDFFYLRHAQQRLAASRQASPNDGWGEWKRIAPGEHAIARLTVIGPMLMSCLLLTALWRRRRRAAAGSTQGVAEYAVGAPPAPGSVMPLFSLVENTADVAKAGEGDAGPWRAQAAPG